MADGIHDGRDSVFLCGFMAPGKHRLDTEVVWWDDAISGTREARGG
jgi:hypothetical protein